MVRPEQHPPLHRLGANRGAGREGGRRRGPAQPEEDRAGCMGSHQEASGLGIVTQEEFGVGGLGGPDRFGLHVTRSPVPGRFPVRDQFPGDRPGRPRDRGRRAHQSLVGPLRPEPGPPLLELPSHLRDRHDLPNGSPVQGGGKGSGRSDHGGVRPLFPRTGSPEHGGPRSLEELFLASPGKRATPGKGADRAAPYLTAPAGSTFAPTEPGREGAVAAGLPRNVGVQTDQAWLADQVDPRRPREREQFREHEGRAAPGGGIGIVDPDPERHRMRTVRSAPP